MTALRSCVRWMQPTLRTTITGLRNCLQTKQCTYPILLCSFHRSPTGIALELAWGPRHDPFAVNSLRAITFITCLEFIPLQC